MKKDVLSWFVHVEQMSDKRIAKKIYEKVSGRKSRGTSRLSFKNTLSKILEEGHVKSTRNPRRACIKKLMTVDEVKDVCRDRSVWRFVLSDYPIFLLLKVY